MKNLKTTMLTLAIAMLVSLGAKAQVQEEKKLTDDQKKEIVKQTRVNTESLGLTDAQKEPFREINKRYGEKFKEVRKSDGTKLDKVKAAKVLKEAKNKEMKALLTAEQYQIYLKNQEERIKNTIDIKKG